MQHTKDALRLLRRRGALYRLASLLLLGLEITAGSSHIGVTPTSLTPVANGVRARGRSPAYLNAAMVSGRHACTRPSRQLHNEQRHGPAD